MASDQKEKEKEAEEKLIDAIHAAADAKQIEEDSNGELVYRYGDYVITVKPGNEKLKVKSSPPVVPGM